MTDDKSLTAEDTNIEIQQIFTEEVMEIDSFEKTVKDSTYNKIRKREITLKKSELFKLGQDVSVCGCTFLITNVQSRKITLTII